MTRAFCRAKIRDLWAFQWQFARKNRLSVSQTSRTSKFTPIYPICLRRDFADLLLVVKNIRFNQVLLPTSQIFRACAEDFQRLSPEAIPAFLQNLQNSANYNIAKPIARPAAYHPYHRPSHQPPQRHLPPNAHHTLQQLFYRGPYLTGKRSSLFKFETV